MKNLILLVLLLFTSALTAQNYSNICSPGNIIYHSGDQYKEIRVDSVQPLGNNDTLFITFPTIRILAERAWILPEVPSLEGISSA